MPDNSGLMNALPQLGRRAAPRAPAQGRAAPGQAVDPRRDPQVPALAELSQGPVRRPAERAEDPRHGKRAARAVPVRRRLTAGPLPSAAPASVFGRRASPHAPGRAPGTAAAGRLSGTLPVGQRDRAAAPVARATHAARARGPAGEPQGAVPRRRSRAAGFRQELICHGCAAACENRGRNPRNIETSGKREAASGNLGRCRREGRALQLGVHQTENPPQRQRARSRMRQPARNLASPPSRRGGARRGARLR